jgi:hypothetical protein
MKYHIPSFSPLSSRKRFSSGLCPALRKSVIRDLLAILLWIPAFAGMTNITLAAMHAVTVEIPWGQVSYLPNGQSTLGFYVGKTALIDGIPQMVNFTYYPETGEGQKP